MKQLLIHVPLSLNNFMMDNKSEKLGFNASSHKAPCTLKQTGHKSKVIKKIFLIQNIFQQKSKQTQCTFGKVCSLLPHAMD